jgi:hypothetical protein
MYPIADPDDDSPDLPSDEVYVKCAACINAHECQKEDKSRHLNHKIYNRECELPTIHPRCLARLVSKNDLEQVFLLLTDIQKRLISLEAAAQKDHC